MGMGWNHSFNHRLTLPRVNWASPVDSEYHMVIYEVPSGNRLRFLQDGDTYTALPGVYAQLAATATGYTLTLRDQSVLTFNQLGQVLTQRDANGNTLVYSYYAASPGSAGLLEQVADMAGHALTFTYTTTGNQRFLTAVTDLADRTITLSYDSDGRLSEVSDLRGGTTSYAYLGKRLANIQRRAGNQSIQELINAYSDTWVVGQTLRNGTNLNYSYSSTPQGRATTVTAQKNSQQSSYTDHYRPDGTLEWQEQAGQVRSYLTFDAASLAPTTSVDGAASATLTERNALGQPTSVSDPRGLTTTFTYRTDQRLSQIHAPDSTTVDLTYDSNNHLIETSRTGLLLYEHIFYSWSTTNGSNYPTEMRGDNGVITRYTYTSTGQIAQATRGYGLPEAQTTAFGYDRAGRVVTATLGFGTPLQRIDVTRYNPDGSVAAHIQNYSADGVYNPQAPEQNIRTSYGYDEFGRPIWERDTLGSYTWARGYDSAGRVSWEVRNPRDSSGAPVIPTSIPAYSPAQPDANVVTSYHYDDLSRLVLVSQTGLLTGTFNPATLRWSDTTERATRYEYDALGRVVTTTLNYRPDQPVDLLPDVNVTSIQHYDGAGNLIWERDALGRWTKHEYDAAGNPTATIANYENGDPTTVSYTNGYWPSHSDTDIKTVTQYSGVGRVWKVIQNYVTGVYDPLRPDQDRIMVYGYDGLGRVVSTVENQASASRPDLNRTSVSQYDPYTNQLTGQQDALGRWNVSQYDALGRVWQTIENCRDANNQPASQSCAPFSPQTDASNRNIRTETHYDALGRPFETVDPLGAVTRTFYDSLDRAIAVYQNYRPDLPADAQTNVVSRTRYDALGRVVARVDALGHETRQGYNGLGQTSVITDAAGRVSTMGYDGTGAQRWSRTPDGRLTVLRVDGLGRVVETIQNYQDGVVGSAEPTDQDLITRVAYDAAGNTLRVTSPGGQITQFGYDLLDRLISVTENAAAVCANPPCGVSIRYDYDRAGNRTQITDPRGSQRFFSYDAANQLVAARDALQYQTRWEYDAGGRRIRQDDPRGDDFDLTYSFDGRDRLTQIHSGVSDPTLLSEQIYNARDQRLSVVDHSALTSFSYDTLGRITQVGVHNSGTITYGYNALGQRTQLGYPGGDAPSLTYSYKPDGRLDYVAQGGLPLAQYSYDSAGRLQQISRQNGTTTQISYTATDQVRELRTQAGTNDLSRFRYSFDRDGQTSVLTETLDLSTRTVRYSYDGLGRLIGADASSGNDYAYEYDRAGNRTGVWVNGARTVTLSYNAANQVQGWQYDQAGNLLSDGRTSQTYDALGRVSTRTVGGQTTSFTYNSDGVLVAQTDSAGSTTRYVQDLAAPLPQVLQTQTGGTSTNYLYGVGRLAARSNSGAYTWFIADTLGSVRQTLNDSAALLASLTYDPFGTVENGSPAPFGFTGELHDSASGLVYLRARWYNPLNGTFTSRDPFAGFSERPASLHPYAYALSNPIRYKDPTGRCVFIGIDTLVCAGVVIGVFEAVV